MNERGIFGEFSWITGAMFFLDVFIALALISGSWLLVKTDFGKVSMIFGFIMLFVSTALKMVRKW